ncbi:MAG: hypothetical protein L6R38_003392 [Xanthoria sp. 2 TBL-2021]|nr:MAG: hypothetical protein L6R38_003392 [Xanthoria sp. 2 TBL-2021]
MELCYRTIVQSLALTLCFVHLASSPTLQLPSDTLSTSISNHTTAYPRSNELTADQNIANYLQYLASQPASQLNQAKLILVVYGAGGRAPHRVRSANINAHCSLTLAFRSGDYSPTLPHSLTYFRTRNNLPEHWDTWSAPNFYETPPLDLA